ncbi:MAG: hypothetical protein JSW67_14650 [Candidatus Latescibacterota bacterium]|nr:MAG: hypothetical protein JSW67_14650 [Candidatus Latescibacterota bacterium]
MGSRLGACAGAALLLVAAVPDRLHADTRVIDSPTAEPLGHGFMRWEISAGPGGSVLSGVRVGVFERAQFGLSYGMQDVLGRGDVEANPRPGIQAEVLLLDRVDFPAVALGFDSQGVGRWLEDAERYERKSHGFYAVATQSLAAESLPVLTALTGGINYSLEGKRESFDIFLGMSQTWGRSFTLLVDYDFGLDDRLDKDRGYLDLGLQWSFGSGNHLRFILRDLLGNVEGGKVGRELSFFYLFRL